MPDGLEPAAAAAASLDEMIKLPTYSMARIASESDDFVLRAPFPVTNVSPEDDPMPPVPNASEFSPDPYWRPSKLTDVHTAGGIKRIMEAEFILAQGSLLCSFFGGWLCQQRTHQSVLPITAHRAPRIAFRATSEFELPSSSSARVVNSNSVPSSSSTNPLNSDSK